MSSLPEDIVDNILSRLPIYGSCNGLVCIEPRQSVCIWNPSTKEYKQVPEIPIEFPSPAAEDAIGGYKTAYGFGFDHTIDDYKLLRIVGFVVGEVSEARVYTLGSNSWRSLGFIPYNFYDGRNSGLFINGLLYWIATRHGIGSEFSRVIVSFDICDETFHELPLPNNYLTEDFISGLGVWDGKLCVLGAHYEHHHRDHYDVWIMKDDLWRKHLTITAETGVYYSNLIQVFQNGHVLLLGFMTEENTDSLHVYDPKLERARNLEICGLPTDFEIETYIGTLVSLNSGTYVGKEQNIGSQKTRKRRRRLA
ncbi:F-box/kelch-repeat protein At3g06240-like isoform X2 [Papaver somniferum]|uniref:F-box/kelch-repeat protein At3g06240-like isoform X2 n=1 Tax=Papaver somniferum TaxID=3469 RepID=UPI000E6FB1B0|nr:F-box/kelch-repeat protein At3g06240-like isoform X2 [Papaver somniferum]